MAKYHSPRRSALKDIREYLMGVYGDEYLKSNIVYPNFIDCVETRQLNRQLGLWGTNKGKHNIVRR